MANPTATNEMYRENLKRLKNEIEQKHGKSVDELYKERQKRLRDVVELKKPDRVPVMLGGSYFAARQAGLPYSAVYYNWIPWKIAYINMLADYGPDSNGEGLTQSGAYLDLLEAKNARWPGGTAPENIAQQAIDGEWLKDDEYDMFIEDMTDYIIRRYLPRVYGALEPLSKLPAINSGMSPLSMLTTMLTDPAYRKIGETLVKAGEEQKKWGQTMAGFADDIESLGFAPFGGHFGGGAPSGPPFDMIANNYRGWKGIIKDMYKRPDKFIAAMNKLLDMQIARAKPAPKMDGPVFGGGGALHRGSDNFLSKEQWETFYWPTWKKSIQAAIDLGYTPFVFAEGFCEKRLPYFLEFPKGSLVIRLTDTNMIKAREIVGDHFCLMGSVPLTMLQIAQPEEVDAYCKKLIEGCGKDGAYILRADTDYIQDANPNNVRVMVESVFKYGVY